MGFTRRKLTIKIILTAFVAILSISMLIPFVWMISASFKIESDVFNVPVDWIPKIPTLDNYKMVWGSSVPFSKFLLNSIKVTLWCVIGELVTSALAGYAFAKIKFRGREIMFWLYVATLIFPGQMMLIPRFVLFRLTGLYNTHWTLILPGMFTAFGTFMLRQFFMTIPDELSEAAKIDGANHFSVFVKIVLPLSTAALSALVIFQFVGVWNDYEAPLVYIRSKELATIPLGLEFFRDENSTSYGAIMAASVCSLIPIFVVFLTFQRQFVAGIATSGMKE
ncbi:carbohydrate ABC transporter permease [Leadbettera azotonutricia]|uniref:ABC transporter, permease protein n=1 Tax=Leadbettera azotonutricia (strain ATCC BAA-888 / DSM 13862 / ZAS-9) TaxID=545695 RepID=F5YG89_LEAAZ|nr:carbohydrate ABC transporter permease [Leadbettera azotonutricia]AEF81900.1 ABC transporter, permease protein [Leadbettera azotonutricia ZAS-9]